MLSNLKIENIAIIESASIDFENNFNCMTGETGAGKSIVIDSINAILGEKTSRELIRTGESKATVSAFFTDISHGTKQLLIDMNLPIEEDNTLLVSRVMTKDGRNVCKVNGANVTVSILKVIGLSLINIHGQADNQELMSSDKHYTFIDAVADHEELFRDYFQSYSKLLEIKDRIKKLTINETLKARQIDLLQYQIDELTKAEIRIGEKDELIARKKVINNARKILSSLNEAYSILNGTDELPGAVSMLFDASSSLQSISDVMPDVDEMSAQLNDISFTVQSFISDINSMLDNSDFDEREIADIEERLDLIYRLSKKYGDTEEEMLSFLEKAKAELHSITYSDELISQLRAEYEFVRAATEEKAYALSDSRKRAAEVFSEKIQNELMFLDMPDTVFSVDFTLTNFTETGIDDIQFLISANKGEEPKPLAKIASGGELSRIMLAIKSVLADKDEIPTLIFDEIDTGVSGSAAEKIALKLHEVSAGRQVICVTHLARIAAQCDNHMKITKSVEGEKTYTKICNLDFNGRVNEIARISGGKNITQLQLKAAEEMILNAMKDGEKI